MLSLWVNRLCLCVWWLHPIWQLHQWLIFYSTFSSSAMFFWLYAVFRRWGSWVSLSLAASWIRHFFICVFLSSRYHLTAKMHTRPIWCQRVGQIFRRSASVKSGLFRQSFLYDVLEVLHHQLLEPGDEGGGPALRVSGHHQMWRKRMQDSALSRAWERM